MKAYNKKRGTEPEIDFPDTKPAAQGANPKPAYKPPTGGGVPPKKDPPKDPAPPKKDPPKDPPPKKDPPKGGPTPDF